MRRLLTIAVALLASAACSNGTSPRSIVPTESPVATTPPAGTSPPASPTATSATTMRVPVYYLGGSDRVVLYREFRSVPRSTAVVRSAVDAMLHLTPLDTDYRSLWPRATTVLGVSVSGTTATVDLSKDARGVTTTAASEQASLQQLVYTVTGAAPSVTAVRLHVGGATPATLWGHVDTTKPLARADQSQTLGPVWVLEPVHHATVHRTFTVTGTASVFEATVSWSVTKAGKTLASGAENATAGGPARGTYSVTVTLPSGTSGDVVFTAWEASAEDGRVTFADTKTYRVT
jgi:spore germination protein GerM